MEKLQNQQIPFDESIIRSYRNKRGKYTAWNMLEPLCLIDLIDCLRKSIKKLAKDFLTFELENENFLEEYNFICLNVDLNSSKFR